MQKLTAVDIIAHLEGNDLVPAIIFRSSRRQCDLDCFATAQAAYFRLGHRKEDAIRQRVKQICEEFNLPYDILSSYRFTEVLVKYGVAPHHAGHLSSWRILIEKLMSEGFLRAIFATSTVSAGVDFPARTVVITSLKKKGHFGVNYITPTELHQMSGRAGRRGKDKVGFCLFAVESIHDLEIYKKLVNSPPEPLVSWFYPSPSTILSTLKYRDIQILQQLVQKSFGAFLKACKAKGDNSSETIKAKTSQRWGQKKTLKSYKLKTQQGESELERLALVIRKLEEFGFLAETFLTEKGKIGAEINSSYVVEIVEILSSDLTLIVDSPLSLLSLFGFLSSDYDRNLLNGYPPVPKQVYPKLNILVKRVNSAFIGLRPFVTFVDKNASYTVSQWAQAKSWSEFAKILDKKSVAIGDVARQISQTIDIMNQLTKLEKIMPDIAYFAEESKKMLLRHPFSEVV